ncbi:MAG: hypothetical protein Q4D24_12365 [Erysipelotrichaceae bacterium]|nr:hypothetical protein [Erysipelotrichaceae bacterium]
MKRRKRLFTAVLSLIMMLSLLPAGTLAEEEASPTDLPTEEEVLLPEEFPEEIQEEEPDVLLTEEEQEDVVLEEVPEEESSEEVTEELPEEELMEEILEEEISEEVQPEEPAAENEAEEPELEAETETEEIPEPAEEPESEAENMTDVVEYELWVGGVQVTSANQKNIKGDEITGTVTYKGDASGGTLTLNNATITGSFVDPLYPSYGTINIYARDSIKNLTILLIGKNTVGDGNTRRAVWSWYDLMVTGDGSLTANSQISTGELTVKKTSLYVSSGNVSQEMALSPRNGLTISDSTVEAKGGIYGIFSSWGGLSIEGNSKVTAEGTNAAIVCQTKSASFNIDSGLGITEPFNGVIASTNGLSVYEPDRTTYAKKAVIEPSWNGLQAELDKGGSVILERDYTAGEHDTALTIQEGKNVTLYLNGHTLDRNLTKVTDNGGVMVNNGSLTIVGSGTLTGGYNTGAGGAIYNAGTLMIKGGRFTGNTAYEAGAVYNAKGSSLTIEGGTFSENTVFKWGGGGVVNYGTMEFAGGTIRNNTVPGNGGGIWTADTLSITGGQIVNNSAGGNGGGIYYKEGTLSVSGNTLIKENSPNNLYMLKNNLITVSGLLTGAQIGVTTQTAPVAGKPLVITTGLYYNLASDCFFSDQGHGLFSYEWEAALYADFPEKFEINIDQEYLVLAKGTPWMSLEASVEPAAWANLLRWRTENKSDIQADHLYIDPNGTVCSLDPQSAGTAWVVAWIELEGKVFAEARCRVDIVDGDFTEGPVGEEVSSVRLLTNSTSVDLYSTDYARIQILPELPQNNKMFSAAVPDVVPQDPGEETSAAIWDARFNDFDMYQRFKLRPVDDRTLEIIPTNAVLAGDVDVKESYSAAIVLNIEGEQFNTEAKLNLTVKKTLPKIKAKALTFNSDLQETKLVVYTGGTVLPGKVELNPDKMQPDWLSFNAGTGELFYCGDYQATKKGEVYLKVQPEGWAVKIPVTASVSARSIPPKVTFKTKTLTLKPGTSDEASTTYTISPAAFQGETPRFSRITENGKDVEDSVLHVTAGSGTVTIKANPTDGKAHTYKVYFSVLGKESVLTVKTLADTKKVTMKLTSKGAIDLAVDKSPVTITASTANVRTGTVTFTLKEITKGNESGSVKDHFRIRQSGNVFTLTAYNNSAETGSYTAAIEADYGSGTVEKTVRFTVKKTAKTPVSSLTLKTTGSIDVLRPGKAVKLTPVFKNVYDVDLNDDIQLSVIMTYDGILNEKCMENATSRFNIEVVNNEYWLITPIPDERISHKDKYIVTAVSSGITSGKSVSLKVIQGKAKVMQDRKSVTLLKTDRYSRGEVQLTLSDASLRGIDDVQIVSPKNKSGREYFVLVDCGGGLYAIEYNDGLLPADIAKLKTQTVKLNVILKGNLNYTPNTTLSVKVNFK